MLDRITGTLQFHGEALALRARRQQVLASNIANADTPNYQARDFDFGQALQRTVSHAGVAPATRTDASRGFLPIGDLASSPHASMQWRTPQQPSIDRNTVDLDRERANFADNSLRYEATLRFINSHVRATLSAIRGD